MMENGYDGKFAEKFSALAISNAADTIRSSNANHNHQNDSSLFQVMKAVEAAEATIKQQVEENLRLRTELQHKILELDRYKLDESMAQRSPSVDPWSEGLQTSFQAHQTVPTVDGQDNRIKSTDAPIQSHAETQSNNGTINGTMKLPTDIAGSSHLSSPSTTSFSPGRFNTVGEYDPPFNFSGQGLMPMAELNTPSSLWKQDLSVKIHEHEEEIMRLRKHLANYSIKEAQICNEKYVLEKRIAYMRLAFDQQQQDLVDAASKALSYRQDIIEENIRLTYALQDAQQERSTFVSSLLPLLAEYSLQPPVPDAQSIVSNVKAGESVDCLLLHCPFSLKLWETLLKEVNTVWVIPEGCFELFSFRFDAFGRGKKAKVLWGSLMQAVVWNLWLERNRRIFED